MLGAIRILDLTQGAAGPFCTQILADMGAEVLKVEPPGTGDITRAWGPPFVAEAKSAYFFALNRNKRSVVLDLKRTRGRRALRALLKNSDVLVESFRPGVMARLDFDPEILTKSYPKLVVCSVTGFGQDGPSAGESAFDNIIQARSGLMSVTGEDDGPPMKFGVPITDLGTGIYAALAIMTALYARSATGKGARIDVSLLDSATSWLSYWLTGYSVTGSELPRLGNAHPTLAPYQVFRTRDGSVALGVSSDRIWTRFASAVGRKYLASDPRFRTNKDRVERRGPLAAEVSGILARFSTKEFTARMKKAGVPCSPVQTVPDAAQDPQLLHRKMIMKIDGIKVPGFPIKMTSLRRGRVKPPPGLGEDTVSVMQEVGWSDSEIGRLMEEVEMK